MVTNQDQDWFKRRLVRFTSGLLSPEESERFHQLAGSDSACGELLAAFTEDPVDPSELGHIPASVLAVWPRATKTLRGLERDAIRTHLERCSDCREDLTVLGFEPVLEADPGDVARADNVVRLEGRRPSPMRRVRLAAAGFGLAAAASLALVLWGPALTSRGVAEIASGHPMVTAPQMLRSAEPDLIEVTLRADQGLTFQPRPLGDPGTARFRVVLVDPSGRQVVRRATEGDLGERGEHLELHPQGGWVAGIYELEVTGGRGREERATYRFRVEIDEP